MTSEIEVTLNEPVSWIEDYEQTFKGLIDKLYTTPGTKIEVTFSTGKEADSFNSQIYRAKRRWELERIGLGMISEEEVRILSCKSVVNIFNVTHTYTLSEKALRKKWNIKIIEPETSEKVNAE